MVRVGKVLRGLASPANPTLVVFMVISITTMVFSEKLNVLNRAISATDEDVAVEAVEADDDDTFVPVDIQSSSSSFFLFPLLFQSNTIDEHKDK